VSEELIIKHCAPTLAGIKTANLFSCQYKSSNNLKNDISRLNKILIHKGLRIMPLKYSNNRVLIYLYRPCQLNKDFNEHTCKLLSDMGYPCSSPERCIIALSKKLKIREKFPHEIGLFLGYPLEDVMGFINNNANNYKCVGYWKVYGDEKKAKKLFGEYKICKDKYYKQWTRGITIDELIVAS